MRWLLPIQPLLALFALIGDQIVRAESEPPKIAAKVKHIVEEGKYRANYDESFLYGSGQVVMSQDLDEALPAAVALWISRHNTRALYAAWWEQRDRHVRLLLAFLLCGENDLRAKEMRSELPAHADRFAEPERSQRKDELDYVIANKKVIARWFKAKLLPVVGEKALERFE